MAILKYLLRFLEFLRLIADFVEFLTSPIGITAFSCVISYQTLLVVGCNYIDAAILASAIALTLHSVLNRPKF